MYTWKVKSKQIKGAKQAYTTTQSQHSKSHISIKWSMVGDIGSDPFCGLLLGLLFCVTKEDGSLLDAECHNWSRWLAWAPKEQSDEKVGDGGLKFEWRSGSEVVENDERYSPFIEGRHGATAVAYQPLVVGLAEGLERWLLRWGVTEW
jgi:hypothetical protein